MLVEDRVDGSGVSPARGGEQSGQWRLAGDTVANGPCECDPVFVTAFARQRMLNVAKRDVVWRTGIGPKQSCPSVGVAIAQRFQPALGRFPEIVEGGHVRPPSVLCLASA